MTTAAADDISFDTGGEEPDTGPNAPHPNAAPATGEGSWEGQGDTADESPSAPEPADSTSAETSDQTQPEPAPTPTPAEPPTPPADGPSVPPTVPADGGEATPPPVADPPAETPPPAASGKLATAQKAAGKGKPAATKAKPAAAAKPAADTAKSGAITRPYTILEKREVVTLAALYEVVGEAGYATLAAAFEEKERFFGEPGFLELESKVVARNAEAALRTTYSEEAPDAGVIGVLPLSELAFKVFKVKAEVKTTNVLTLDA